MCVTLLLAEPVCTYIDIVACQQLLTFLVIWTISLNMRQLRPILCIIILVSLYYTVHSCNAAH